MIDALSGVVVCRSVDVDRAFLLCLFSFWLQAVGSPQQGDCQPFFGSGSAHGVRLILPRLICAQGATDPGESFCSVFLDEIWTYRHRRLGKRTVSCSHPPPCPLAVSLVSLAAFIPR